MFIRKFVVLIILIVASGCADVESLVPGRGSSFSVSDRDYNEIWKAAVKVVGRSLTIVDSDKGSGRIRSEARAGAMTFGEVIGVFITPTLSGKRLYTVEVISLKRYQVQITGQNWEPTIIAGIKAELDL
jgi:hypothetical protein